MTGGVKRGPNGGFLAYAAYDGRDANHRPDHFVALAGKGGQGILFRDGHKPKKVQLPSPPKAPM